MTSQCSLLTGILNIKTNLLNEQRLLHSHVSFSVSVWDQSSKKREPVDKVTLANPKSNWNTSAGASQIALEIKREPME